MTSALNIQLLIALIAITLLTVKTASFEDEGLACNDMASALPKLQTLTGTPLLTFAPDLLTKAMISDLNNHFSQVFRAVRQYGAQLRLLGQELAQLQRCLSGAPSKV